MKFDLNALKDRTVFVDANAFLYYFQGISPLTREIFRYGAEKRLKLITTTRIMDEVIHKNLLIQARNVFGWKSKTIYRLRQEPEKMKLLVPEVERFFQLAALIRLEMEAIRPTDLSKMPKMMTEHGLLGSDSLVLIVMNRLNLKFLLSSDSDFHRVSWVERIPCDPDLA
ncbi:MAG: type II toxin-antitoxin system VapC family toxin [Desulfococcaceae bacterium]